MESTRKLGNVGDALSPATGRARSSTHAVSLLAEPARERFLRVIPGMTISRSTKRGLRMEFWTRGICFIKSGLLSSAPAQWTLNFLFVDSSQSVSMHRNCPANVSHHLSASGWSCCSLQTKFASHWSSERSGRDFPSPLKSWSLPKLHPEQFDQQKLFYWFKLGKGMSEKRIINNVCVRCECKHSEVPARSSPECVLLMNSISSQKMFSCLQREYL